MPGLTGDLLIEKAEELGMPPVWQMVNFTKSQWESLKLACSKALHLPPNWEDLGFSKVSEEMRDLGWGTQYGPIGTTTYKRKGLGKVKIPQAQGDLFETL